MIKSYKLRRHIANAFVYLFLIVMGFRLDFSVHLSFNAFIPWRC